MKNTHKIIIGLIALGLIGGFVYLQVVRPELDNRTVVTVVPQMVASSDFEFGFTYPSGEAGYTLIEPPISTTTAEGLQKVYLIMDTQEYVSFQATTSDGETPPSVSIFVFEMPTLSAEVEAAGRAARLQAWAELYPQYSSITLRTEDPEPIKLDGATALRYRTDGLFQQEVHLVSYQSRVYVFTGQFDDESDAIRAMYTELIRSVTFD